MTGELTRVRFGPGVEAAVAWLQQLPGPVRGCYKAYAARALTGLVAVV